MPQKKPSPYMEFVMEWRAKNAPRMAIDAAVKRVDPLWKNLSPQERERYKEKAKNSPSLPKSSKGKLTCDGIPIEVIENEQREKERLHELMLKTIRETVATALNSNNLLDKKFYFIQFNHFIRVLHTNDYIPAEVAVIEFSLKNGVNRKYHEFIDPKMEFYGNVYEAKHHAETTHQLPLPPSAFGDKEPETIYDEILDFIGNEAANVYPPVYTNEKEIPLIKSCLEFLMGSDDIKKLRVYSIQQLFFDFKCATVEYAGDLADKPKNKFITDAQLERDAFQYTNDIACDYHEEIDRAHYCALSKVIRYAFTFADYMGKDVNLSFIPGKHMPGHYKPEVKAPVKPKEMPSDASTISLKSAFSQLSLKSDDFATVNTSSVGKLPPPSTASQNLSISVNESFCSTNPWKRHDTSQPPDSRFFDIDCPEYEARAAKPPRRSVGRGIVIFDDEFPSLGRGRKTGPR